MWYSISIYGVLSCNEYAECRVMVNCRTNVGARALCAWLRKYKIVIGDRGEGGVFYEVIRSFLWIRCYCMRRGVGMLHVDRLIHLFKCSCAMPESFWGG